MSYSFGDIGELLLEKGVINNQQLQKIRLMQKEKDEHILDLLARLKYVTKNEALKAISEKIGVPYVDLTNDYVNPNAISFIPEDIARKFKVIPILFVAERLVVAMADPNDIFSIDGLKVVCPYPVDSVLAGEIDIEQAIDYYYRGSKEIKQITETVTGTEDLIYEKDLRDVRLKEEEEGMDPSPIIRLMDRIITEAIKQGASDIHMEGEEGFVRIRFRVDGVLSEFQTLQKKVRASLISRIKILSDLDLAHSLTPQDGSFFVHYQGRRIDFRVATIPTHNGENAVIRILDSTRGKIRLSQLGIHPMDLSHLRNTLQMPNGMIIVSGPTGSGKTTTLYACIDEINTIKKKIITIEDPVEYRMEIVNQIPIKVSRGMTFAKTLRSVLRFDPDIILVGEIRDQETARIAIQGALTGHLILTTLHTNGTIESIFRLMDMGIEHYFVREILRTVVSQRLVRKLCPQCKTPVEVPVKSLGEMAPYVDGKTIQIYQPEGCDNCRNTGFIGRVAVYEFLFITPELKKQILPNSDSELLRRIALKEGLKSYWENASIKLKKGITSFEELKFSYSN